MYLSPTGKVSRALTVDRARTTTNAGHVRSVKQQFATSVITVARTVETRTARNVSSAARAAMITTAEVVSNIANNAASFAATAASMNKKGVASAMNNKLKKQMKTKLMLVESATPVLRFSPTAWAKLLFLRDYGETEVGGFGIADDDLLFVEDVQLVQQTCSWAHVAFDDESVADFFDAQVDLDRKPEQFARLWLHTHPGECPQPSFTDEETFDRVFGRSDWALMFIVAREGQTYARLRFNVGPGGEIEIPVEVDYSRQFSGSDLAAWEQQYLANVCPELASQPRVAGARRMDADGILGAELSELNDPFFVADEPGWFGLWPDDERVTDEQMNP
jgi:hypothetical protein